MSVSTLLLIRCQCRTSRVWVSIPSSACFSQFSALHSSIVCMVCAYVLPYVCALPQCVSVCVRSCVRGPAPPCPLTRQRLRGSLAFRFKLNHADESSLFFPLSLHPPLLPKSPYLFSLSFFMWVLERKQESERYRSRLHVVLNTGFFLYTSPWSGFYCSHLTYSDTHIYSFSLSHLPLSTLSICIRPPHYVLSLPNFPHSHVWQRITAWESENRLFTPLNWQTVYLLTHLIIIPTGPNMKTPSPDATKISVDACCQDLAEKETWAHRGTLKRTHTPNAPW